MRFYRYIVIGIMPLCMHFTYDFICANKIEYINYNHEIYILNVFIFGYFFICYFNKMNILGKINENLLLIGLGDFLVSTSVYVMGFDREADMKLKKIEFFVMVVLTFVNLIVNSILAITYREKDTEKHYSKNTYEEYPENRYERYLLERIDEKLNSINNSTSEKNKEGNETKKSEELINGSDILAEMLRNHIEIKEYFKISKNQSKFSFYFSIISSVIGIIVVIIAASGIVVFKDLGISIIAAVSGAITEIISGIVLWIHNKSALQLNYYYDSLHENEKFLSAVNIADKLSEEKKEDMYIEIIRKQIDIRSKDKENKATDTGKE